MKKTLKHIIKFWSNLITLFNKYLKKLEIFLAEDNLILIRTSHNTLGRNKTFILSNQKLLEKQDLFFQIYMFLVTNKTFLEFGEYKVVIVNGKVNNNSFNLHHNILIKNETSFEEYWNKNWRYYRHCLWGRLCHRWDSNHRDKRLEYGFIF